MPKEASVQKDMKSQKKHDENGEEVDEKTKAASQLVMLWCGMGLPQLVILVWLGMPLY